MLRSTRKLRIGSTSEMKSCEQSAREVHTPDISFFLMYSRSPSSKSPLAVKAQVQRLVKGALSEVARATLLNSQLLLSTTCSIERRQTWICPLEVKEHSFPILRSGEEIDLHGLFAKCVTSQYCATSLWHPLAELHRAGESVIRTVRQFVLILLAFALPELYLDRTPEDRSVRILSNGQSHRRTSSGHQRT